MNIQQLTHQIDAAYRARGLDSVEADATETGYDPARRVTVTHDDTQHVLVVVDTAEGVYAMTGISEADGTVYWNAANGEPAGVVREVIQFTSQFGVRHLHGDVQRITDEWMS